MSFTKKNYQSIESVSGLHFLRKPLKLENQGFTVLEASKGYEGKAHNHKEKGHEEVYFLVEGEGRLEVNGDQISLVPGDAVRVSPEADRTLYADEESTFVISGAP